VTGGCDVHAQKASAAAEQFCNRNVVFRRSCGIADADRDADFAGHTRDDHDACRHTSRDPSGRNEAGRAFCKHFTAATTRGGNGAAAGHGDTAPGEAQA
jgi:hypothetical protein